MRTLIDDLRANLAAGSCLCSSAHTDWRGVEDLLDRLEAAEAKVAAVEALADEWAGSVQAHREAASRDGDVERDWIASSTEHFVTHLRRALGEARP